MGHIAYQARPVVLVVEDEPIQRMDAMDIVEAAGFDAVEAASADEAIRILESRPDIRIVFTDIDMPNGLEGLKLAAAIRDRWPPIEIIITSGRTWPRPEDMPSRGVFFPKPYQRQAIAEMMRQMAG